MGIIIRQSIKATIVNYIGTGIGFLTTMFIVVRFLPTEIVGLTSVLLNAALMFSSFAQLGIGSSAVRFFPYFKNPEKKHNGFFFYLVSIPLLGACIVALSFLFLKGPVSDYFRENSDLFVDYYYWTIPFGCFLLYTVVFETYATVLMRIAVPKMIKEIGFRLVLIVVYVLYGLHWITLNEFIACYVMAYGLTTLAIFYYVSRIGPVSLRHDKQYADKSLRRNFLSYTSLIVIGSLGGTLISRIDTFMVSSNLGLSYTGIYTIALYMATVIEIPSRSITAISSPLAAEALRQGDFGKANRLYRQVSLHQLISGSLIFLLIWVNLDNIYDIIPKGDAYRAGRWVVCFIGLSKLIEITLGFGGTMISYSRYYHWTLYFSFFITALTIVSNNLLIPVYGITGAALATALTCLVSYGIQQGILFLKVKGNPYSLGMLKQAGLIVFLLGIDRLLPALPSPWLDIMYRSAILVVLGVPLLYLLKISPEVNSLIRKAIGSVLKK